MMESLHKPDSPVASTAAAHTSRSDNSAPWPEDYINLRPASAFLYEGQKRILLEMESTDEPAVSRLLVRYEELVDQVCRSIKRQAGKQPLPAQFINCCSGIMEKELGIIYGQNQKGFLSESVDTMIFDCDNSALLALDVARHCGLGAEFVLVPGHALLEIGHVFWETTCGEMLTAEQFRKKYPYFQAFSSTEMVQSVSLHQRGLQAATTARALADYTAAINFNPDYAAVLNQRGRILFGLGMTQQALNDFRKAASLGDPDAFENMGQCLCRLNRVKEAIQVYSKLISTRSQRAQVYYHRGNAYLRMHRFKEAEADYREAIRLKPGLSAAYGRCQLALVHQKAGRNFELEEPALDLFSSEAEPLDHNTPPDLSQADRTYLELLFPGEFLPSYTENPFARAIHKFASGVAAFFGRCRSSGIMRFLPS